MSFKANTDDIRESPALEILRVIVEKFTNVVVYDPHAKNTDLVKFDRVDSLDKAVSNADLVVILTEWPEFIKLDASVYAELMAGKTIVDARYVLNTDRFASEGITVRSLGR
jgi:UDPglucose 6-dehydrogenase